MKLAFSNNSLLPSVVLKTKNHTQALTHGIQKSECKTFKKKKKMCLGYWQRRSRSHENHIARKSEWEKRDK